MSRDALHETSDVVAMFARQGIAIDTISRAMAIPAARIVGMCERARECGDIQMIPPATAADRKGALVAEVTNLRAQLDDALARARDAEDRGTYENLQGVAGLTGSEAKIAGTLMRSGRATKSVLMHSLYGEQDWRGEKTLDVMICKARKKLRVVGVEIETMWGVGYLMTRENADRLRVLAEQTEGLPFVASPSLVPIAGECVL